MSRLSSTDMKKLINASVDILQRRSERFYGVDVENVTNVATCAQQVIDAAIDLRALVTVEAQIL